MKNMKTLDEVIALMEDERRCDVPMYKDDALYYLKEYRSDKALYEADRKNWEDDLSQKLRFFDEARNKLIAKYKELEIGTLNEPLTWKELQQMEGKPVWVEAESLSIGVSPYWKDWYIIKSFSDDDFMYCNDGYVWAKETQGRMWQAYRKERS